jgi:hypothetical protein
MSAGFSQESKQERQRLKKEQTDMLVNSREFVFNAKRAFPSRGSSIDLTTNPGYVKFSPDFIDSSMPFFGRAYSGVGYGGDAGLRFNGKPETFTIEKKKKNYQILVNVKGDRDSYKLFLTVMPDGNGSLTISSNNRESITYQGEIVTPKKKE